VKGLVEQRLGYPLLAHLLPRIVPKERHELLVTAVRRCRTAFFKGSDNVESDTDHAGELADADSQFVSASLNVLAEDGWRHFVGWFGIAESCCGIWS
jgi:hypothetical protein